MYFCIFGGCILLFWGFASILHFRFETWKNLHPGSSNYLLYSVWHTGAGFFYDIPGNTSGAPQTVDLASVAPAGGVGKPAKRFRRARSQLEQHWSLRGIHTSPFSTVRLDFFLYASIFFEAFWISSWHNLIFDATLSTLISDGRDLHAEARKLPS